MTRYAAAKRAKNHIARANIAQRLLLKYAQNNQCPDRTFDDCFEMGDGHKVAALLYKRAMNNQALATVLPKYVTNPQKDLTKC